MLTKDAGGYQNRENFQELKSKNVFDATVNKAKQHKIKEKEQEEAKKFSDKKE
ncbi:hypothetical protein [Carnobacterium divergens]|uniref:Uncharacterized protein n=1 Tax=Carnobacterium divergens DSM 20623 TaxID=1449336 RepID=A0A0R2HYD1_CARDV|nr:hypothetical protein [Carnobacterium divergens]KRN57640.1 hypothetical protein IV74_GL001588 [Carnobacterium divergens DSM 20623]MDO0875785.1 hypothetical protein [Carnobacterium divergens]SUX16313.1 Uncharacterised protein [Carnobacterium divergens]